MANDGADDAGMLVEQEAFLSSKSHPSAKVFRTQTSGAEPNVSQVRLPGQEEKPSPGWYQQMKGVKFRLDDLEDDSSGAETTELKKDAPGTDSGFQLLGDIVERDTSKKTPVFSTKSTRQSARGFPSPRRFWQSKLESKNELPEVPNPIPIERDRKQPEGKELLEEIDRENRKKLAEMSEDEILELQRSLQQSLPVALQEKLLRKGPPDLPAPSVEEPPEPENTSKPLHKEPSNNAPIDDTSFDSHLRGFFTKDEIAVDQPEWTLPVHPAEEAFYATPDTSHPEPSTMRFDFNGKYIPPRTSRSLPTYLGLHHHSLDPGAAGYTLSELAILARSIQPSQKCIALKIMGFLLADVAGGKYAWDINEGLWDEIDRERIIEILLQVAKGGQETGGNLSVQRYAKDAVQRWVDAGGPQLWEERLQKKGYKKVDD
jgi:RNA polymerase II-associated protein 1